MARAWRIEYEGALYHVHARGNERRDIFADDDDRRSFLCLLGEAARRFAIEVFAYALMPDHYHLLFRTRRANLSRAMQWLGAAYSTRFNARHARCGHLFQGRFRNMLVQAEAHLVPLSHYIHRNPLRAGIVERISAYPWSSYRVYAHGRPAPEWLHTEAILGQFAGAADRHAAYRRSALKAGREEQRLWEHLRHGFLFGDEGFAAATRSAFLPAAPHPEMPQQKRLAVRVDPASALQRAAAALGADLGGFRRAGREALAPKLEERDLLIYLAWEAGGLTNAQIGELFGLCPSAVSRRVRVFRPQVERRAPLREKYHALKPIFSAAPPALAAPDSIAGRGTP
jgi:REP element-mobilizing transposase RayT